MRCESGARRLQPYRAMRLPMRCSCLFPPCCANAFVASLEKPRTRGHSTEKMSASERIFGCRVRECEVFRHALCLRFRLSANPQVRGSLRKKVLRLRDFVLVNPRTHGHFSAQMSVSARFSEPEEPQLPTSTCSPGLDGRPRPARWLPAVNPSITKPESPWRCESPKQLKPPASTCSLAPTTDPDSTRWPPNGRPRPTRWPPDAGRPCALKFIAIAINTLHCI